MANLKKAREAAAILAVLIVSGITVALAIIAAALNAIPASSLPADLAAQERPAAP